MDSEQNLLKIIKALIIVSFFTPLVMGPVGITFSSYPKAVFFKITIEAAFIFYLFLIYFYPKYFPKINPLMMAVLVFYLIMILSALFGINPQRSFLGTLDRAEGLIFNLHFLVLFFLLCSVYNKEEWKNLLKISFIVCSLSSFAAVLQKLGLFEFYGNSLPARMSGTLANPDFFGAYMALSVFLGLIVFLQEKEKDYRIFWLFLMAMNFFTLVLSLTRAAFFGLLIGLAFLAFFLSFKSFGFSFKKRIAVLILISAFLALGIFSVLNKERLGLDRIYLFNRFFSVFDISANSARSVIWEMTLRSWKERPFLGYGPETFGYLFDKNYKQEYLKYTGEIYFDYPHNKYLGLLSDSGLLGLLSFFSIICLLFYYLFKNKKEILFSDKYPFFAFILAGFLIAYLIQNFFSFDTIATYFLFFLIAAFVNNNFVKSKEFSFRIKSKLLVALLLSLSLYCLFFINIKPTLASLSYVKALKIANQKNKDFSEVIANLKKSMVSKTVYDKDFKMEGSKMLIFYIESGAADNNLKESFDLLEIIRQDIEERIKGKDIRHITCHEILAKIYELNYIRTQDKDYLLKMEDVLNKGMAFSNQHPRLYQSLAQAKILQGQYQEGENLLKKSYEMKKPQEENLAEEVSYYKTLGRMYLSAKDYKKGGETFKKVIDFEYENWQKNPNFFNDYIKDAQAEAIFWENVAFVFYKNLNDKKTCQEIYKKAMEVFPQYKSIFQSHLYIIESID